MEIAKKQEQKVFRVVTCIKGTETKAAEVLLRGETEQLLKIRLQCHDQTAKVWIASEMAGNVQQRKSVFFRTQQKRQVVLSDVPSACMLLLMEWKVKTMQTLHGLPAAAGIRDFSAVFPDEYTYRGIP